MKKLKYFFMSALMLMAGAGSAAAQGEWTAPEGETDIRNLEWVNKGQDCTVAYNTETGTVFGTDNGNAPISYVDLSAYSVIKIYRMDGSTDAQARLFLNRAEYGDANGIIFVNFDENGVATFDCNTLLTSQPGLQYIHLNGVKASAYNTQLAVKGITASGSPIEFPEVFVFPEGESDVTELTKTPSTWTPTNNLGKNTDQCIWGTDGSGSGLPYVDITNYGYLKVYAPEGQTVRAFINRGENMGTDTYYITIDQKDDMRGSYGVLDLSTVDGTVKAYGYKTIHLNGFKAKAWSESAQIDHIGVYGKAKDFFTLKDDELDLTTLAWVNKGQGCANNFGVNTGAPIFGTDAGATVQEGQDPQECLSYVDITNFHELRFYGIPGDAVRCFINRAECPDNVNAYVVTFDENGVGTLKLSEVYQKQENTLYVHLNGIKASNYQTGGRGEAQLNHVTLFGEYGASISAGGYTTFCPVACDMLIPEGVTAYTAKLNNAKDAVILNAIEGGKLPKGCGVVLQGDAGTKYVFKSSNGAETLTDNQMVGATEDMASLSGVYALGVDGDKCFFGAWDGSVVFPAGKAYLSAPAAAKYNNLKIVFNDEATGVSEVSVSEQAQEGKFVEGGKLVIYKGGKKFTAAGAEIK